MKITSGFFGPGFPLELYHSLPLRECPYMAWVDLPVPSSWTINQPCLIYLPGQACFLPSKSHSISAHMPYQSSVYCLHFSRADTDEPLSQTVRSSFQKAIRVYFCPLACCQVIFKQYAHEKRILTCLYCYPWGQAEHPYFQNCKSLPVVCPDLWDCGLSC